MNLDTIYQKVANDLNIPVDIVSKTYRYYWAFIRDKIQELPLKQDLTEEQFNQLRPNFNIPSIGKLCVPYDRYTSIKRQFKYKQKIKENEEAKKDKTNV